MIYPNPLNPRRYVVLNSGFTYRDYDYLNNARQVPKLPDWAVIDIRTPPDMRYPGKVVAADFFGEHWQVRHPHQELLVERDDKPRPHHERPAAQRNYTLRVAPRRHHGLRHRALGSLLP